MRMNFVGYVWNKARQQDELRLARRLAGMNQADYARLGSRVAALDAARSLPARPSETVRADEPYLQSGVVALARQRMGWLLVLMISGMVTGGILGRYEAAFSAMPLLVTFIPMLTDTGGNAGSQSSTLVIRDLALNQVGLRDIWSVLWKELRVSALCGGVLAAVNYVRLRLEYPQDQAVAATVALTLLCTVISAKVLGGVLPLAARRLRMDPAVMASPLITTVVDAVSLVIYFGIASRLLSI